MAHDLWWWSMGVVQWTFWEYAMCRIWATGAVDFATNQQIVSSPKLLVLNIAWVLLVPIWRDLHFYFAHRFLHVRNMYRYCHSLHHRLTNPEVLHHYLGVVTDTCRCSAALQCTQSNIFITSPTLSPLPCFFLGCHQESFSGLWSISCL